MEQLHSARVTKFVTLLIRRPLFLIRLNVKKYYNQNTDLIKHLSQNRTVRFDISSTTGTAHSETGLSGSKRDRW